MLCRSCVSGMSSDSQCCVNGMSCQVVRDVSVSCQCYVSVTLCQNVSAISMVCHVRLSEMGQCRTSAISVACHVIVSVTCLCHVSWCHDSDHLSHELDPTINHSSSTFNISVIQTPGNEQTTRSVV